MRNGRAALTAALAAQIVLFGFFALCVVLPTQTRAASKPDLTRQCVHLAQTGQIMEADHICTLAMKAVRKATAGVVHKAQHQMIVDLRVVPQSYVLDYSRVAESFGIIADARGKLTRARRWFQEAYRWSDQIATDYAPYKDAESMVVSAQQLARRQKAEIVRVEQRIRGETQP